jgi:hypothetical protein
MDKPIPEGVDLRALEEAARYLAGRYSEHDGWVSSIRAAIQALTDNQHPTPRPQGEVDYTDIANRAQAITGRSIFPSTVKAVLEVAGITLANVAELQARNERLAEALRRIIAISDRKHDAWDEAKALLTTNAAQPGETP